MARRAVVGVMGGSEAPNGVLRDAEALGAAIAKAGWVLLNGGRGGVMAASARGAHKEGGFVIGVHPGIPGDAAAADLDVCLYTGLGSARNAVNVLSSDAVVALPGGPGTWSEVALAVKHGRPVVLLGFDDRGIFGNDVARAEDVEEAVRFVAARLEAARLTL